MRTHRKHVHTVVLAALLSLVAATTTADPLILAGSDAPPTSPPTFWTDSFYGLLPSTEHAFPFSVTASGDYWLSLEVPLYRYAGLAGSTADFSICLADAGLPGAEIATFHASGITTTQQVITATAVESVSLDSALDYWIVGSTTAVQINWNLGAYAFGPHAWRGSAGAWVYDDHANVSGFTLIGTPVPEPATLSLVALAGLAGIRSRR